MDGAEAKRYLEDFLRDLKERESVVVTSDCMLAKAIEYAVNMIEDYAACSDAKFKHERLKRNIRDVIYDVWGESRETLMNRYEAHISDSPQLAAFEYGRAEGLRDALYSAERWCDDTY